MLKPRRYIDLNCRKCGRSAVFDRKADPELPDAVHRIETDLCDQCENGDFGSETWFDKDGKEVVPEWAKE